ncbi:MAG: hypothetical protein AYP45_06935 [Candidatus Brocadia carolinensis]|uniref:Uncharacterized protein n=1 Tax=Candidatus Brocadia carolinensis TaxID=1004156 RepID=A0A1V4AUJ0_9BACT|nr:MAG: hypothetical protein AYP45_06935 [Candidatus Brocadia caroliniensis]
MKSIFISILIVVLNASLFILVPRQPLAQDKSGFESNRSATNNYYLKTAKMYFGLNDFTKAIDALALAILLEPHNTEAQKLLKESRRLLEEKKCPAGISIWS